MRRPAFHGLKRCGFGAVDEIGQAGWCVLSKDGKCEHSDYLPFRKVERKNFRRNVLIEVQDALYVDPGSSDHCRPGGSVGRA